MNVECVAMTRRGPESRGCAGEVCWGQDSVGMDRLSGTGRGGRGSARSDKAVKAGRVSRWLGLDASGRADAVGTDELRQGPDGRGLVCSVAAPLAQTRLGVAVKVSGVTEWLGSERNGLERLLGAASVGWGEPGCWNALARLSRIGRDWNGPACRDVAVGVGYCGSSGAVERRGCHGEMGLFEQRLGRFWRGCLGEPWMGWVGSARAKARLSWQGRGRSVEDWRNAECKGCRGLSCRGRPRSDEARIAGAVEVRKVMEGCASAC